MKVLLSSALASLLLLCAGCVDADDDGTTVIEPPDTTVVETPDTDTDIEITE